MIRYQEVQISIQQGIKLHSQQTEVSLVENGLSVANCICMYVRERLLVVVAVTSAVPTSKPSQ